MAIRYNNFEGHANGALVTVGNSSNSGSAWDAIPGDGSLTATSAYPRGASLRAATLTGNTASTYPRWYITGNPTRYVARMWFRIPALPVTATKVLIQILSASGQQMGSINMLAAGTLRCQVNGVSTGPTSSYAVALDTWYALELAVTKEVAGGDGVVEYRLTDDQGTVLATATNTNRATSQDAMYEVRFGMAKTSELTPIVVDDIYARDRASGWLGEYTPQPEAHAGPDQTGINPYATITLDGSGSTIPGGGTPNYQWTQTGGSSVVLSSATSAQPTFTAPATLAGETLTFQLVVDDGTDESEPDTVMIVVAPHTAWMILGGGLVPIKISKLPS